ncbi:AIR synthase-related protein [Wolbachia endosymbiont of Howardula sp.]|uniref:AIR synthase-related protein n=1 Tax=Wolbachia endosymbiont of Howardula sp. TaxID=2916816 RepID=UPI00217F0845|nr:AIR synthase-related protein [Wolbachia endosymbiont of Howardula sp.]UWI83183.1 AIR synthase-related protein [Wolbachia endosymbiont of Howardula sp.]
MILRIEILNTYEKNPHTRTVIVYLIELAIKLRASIYQELCNILHNQVIQQCNYYLYNNSLEEVKYEFIIPHITWGLEIYFLPGITDNIGNTTKQIIQEYLLNQGYVNVNKCISVRSAKLILVQEEISSQDIAKKFNPITEYCMIICKQNNHYIHKYYNDSSHHTTVMKSDIHNTLSHDSTDIMMNVNSKTVDLNVNDQKLEYMSKYGIHEHGGTLGLSLRAMRAIRDYFQHLNRAPYDIELEALAQTWSEHCKHNIFCSPIDEIREGLYSYYIKRATREINSNICVSVFSDNAGGIIFDDDNMIVAKVETHNSPSALDPFGGAMTGLLGVNRDILGFGKGAEPIMNTYYFCFSHNTNNTLYRNQKCTNQVLSSQYIMQQVIHGVQIAGNCSGIPTQLGSVYFDDRLFGQPLVFVGSIGVIPRKINNIPSHIKKIKDGDKIVVIGGRVGRDGMHGATCSSEALSGSIATTIVQIGDPITQKKISNALLDARNLNLYNAITDNGAGGLSSSIGEMGKKGFAVDLSKVLLKSQDMSPWEIWISESQERMTLAVPQKNLCTLQNIMHKHDVEMSVIGEFNNTGMATITTSHDQKIMNIHTQFLHNGNPLIHLQTQAYIKSIDDVDIKSSIIISEDPSNNEMSTQEYINELTEMLSRPNICSKEFIAVQYDHEVQGTSILKPLQGKGRVSSEVIVSRPILSSQKGIVTSQGFGLSYGEVDTYHMAACAIDTAIRHYISAGGNINSLALLDNFCWSDSYNPKRLWQLKRATQACYDYATAFRTPFISGKDSMFNDFYGYNEHGKQVMVSVPPALLISTIGTIDNIEHAISLDVKVPGDLIYLLGETFDELARSEYQAYSKIKNNNVPKVNAQTARNLYECYNQAVNEGIIASAIALNLGGLSIALVKSLIAGKLGAQVDLTLVAIKSIHSTVITHKIKMFSESQSRILVTIAPIYQKRFEELFNNVFFSYIGTVTEEKILDIKDILKTDLRELEKSYHKENFNLFYKK